MNPTTVREILYEAEEPDGLFEIIHKDLHVNVENRPTEHVIRIRKDDDASISIATDYIYDGASNSGYEVIVENNRKYRLRANN